MLAEKVLKELRELAEGDSSFLKSLFQVFLDGNPQRFKNIDSAIRENNPEKLALAAHALKSGCYNVGATGMGDLCKALEKLGSSGTIAGAGPLFQELQVELKKVEQTIAELPEMKSKASFT